LFIYIQIGDINTPFEIDKVVINTIVYINLLPQILKRRIGTQKKLIIIPEILIENR